MSKEIQDPNKIDEIERLLMQMTPCHCPIVHRFTPGMYIREITIPAGVLLTSMMHATEHPFVVSKGRVAVISDNEGRVVYEAPHTGITKPGTRRALFAETEVVWTTFHVTDKTDVEEICNDLLVPYKNPLIEEGQDAPAHWRNSLPTKEEL